MCSGVESAIRGWKERGGKVGVHVQTTRMERELPALNDIGLQHSKFFALD